MSSTGAGSRRNEALETGVRQGGKSIVNRLPSIPYLSGVLLGAIFLVLSCASSNPAGRFMVQVPKDFSGIIQIETCVASAAANTLAVDSNGAGSHFGVPVYAKHVRGTGGVPGSAHVHAGGAGCDDPPHRRRDSDEHNREGSSLERGGGGARSVPKDHFGARGISMERRWDGWREADKVCLRDVPPGVNFHRRVTKIC